MNRSFTSFNTPKNERNPRTPFDKNSDKSKNLWTPCRRLGLSRKIKVTPSPNQSKTTVTTEEQTFSHIVQPYASALTMHEKVESNKQQREEQYTGTPTVIKKCKKPDKPKRINISNSRMNIQTRFEAETNTVVNKSPELNIRNCKIILTTINDITDKVKNSKSKCKKPLQEQTNLNAMNEASDQNLPTEKCELINQKLALKCNNDSLQTVTPSESEKLCVNSVKPEGKTATEAKVNSPISKRTLTKCLSIKKSFSSQDDLSDDDLASTEKSHLPVPFEGISEKSLIDLKMENVEEEMDSSLKSTCKKRRIAYSSDEEDFVASQNLAKKELPDSNDKQEDWCKKIAEVKARIKKKELRLAELKQAAIYKKLHSLEEINQLTSKWKAACESSLQRLLQNIKSHVDIDMLTLIRNLKIDNCVSYDVNTGCFIFN